MIHLELESGLAGRVGQRLDATVKEIPVAIEHHRLHAGGLGPLGDHLADHDRRGAVAARVGLAGLVILRRRDGVKPEC